MAILKSAVIVLALITLAMTQGNDIEGNRRPASMVGTFKPIVVNMEENSAENQLDREAQNKSRDIYSKSEIGAKDPIKQGLMPIVNKQIVSGLLYKFIWETESGNTVTVTVYIVPWQKGSDRYPAVQNQIVVNN